MVSVFEGTAWSMSILITIYATYFTILYQELHKTHEKCLDFHRQVKRKIDTFKEELINRALNITNDAEREKMEQIIFIYSSEVTWLRRFSERGCPSALVHELVKQFMFSLIATVNPVVFTMFVKISSFTDVLALLLFITTAVILPAYALKIIVTKNREYREYISILEEFFDDLENFIRGKLSS